MSVSKFKVLYPKDLVAEYLPGYENNKEFMGLFNKYFVKTVKDNEFWQGQEYHALRTYLYNNLKPDFNKKAIGFKENQKRALSFIKKYKKLETYINRSKNVKRPEAVANREKLKLKLITYWPMARVLENLEDTRKLEEHEEIVKKGEERRLKIHMEEASKRTLARSLKKKKKVRFTIPLEEEKAPQREKDKLTMWDQEHSLTIPPEDDDEKSVPVKRLEAPTSSKKATSSKKTKRVVRRGKVTHTQRANKELNLASNFDEVLQVIPFTLFGVSRQEMDPKHRKLFESYMRKVRDEEKDFSDVSTFSSDWFRTNYPKFQKYMVQNLSFTADEATKFFKKFNALKDKLLYTHTQFTGINRIKFFSYLPTYSALIELEERKYLPAKSAVTESTINQKEFDKVSRSSKAFTKFALNKVFHGAFNNDELFVTLFKDYIDTYIFDWDRFWNQWRYRNTIEMDEKGGMDDEYLDLVKYIKNTYEPWSKHYRKFLANYVKNLERKLDVFTKEGDSQPIKRNNEFRLLSQTLMIYAPFYEAF